MAFGHKDLWYGGWWHVVDLRAMALYRCQGTEWTNLAVKAYHELPSLMVVCKHCRAERFLGEPAGICCLNGKVVLPFTRDAPEPLNQTILEQKPPYKCLVFPKKK